MVLFGVHEFSGLSLGASLIVEGNDSTLVPDAKVWGVAIDVIKGHTFSESRIIMDTIGLLQQLGAIPAPQGGQ